MTQQRPFDDTWLVVPCYNEGPVIGDVLRNALQTFPNICLLYTSDAADE